MRSLVSELGAAHSRLCRAVVVVCLLWAGAGRAELVAVNTEEQAMGSASFVESNTVLSAVPVATEYSIQQSALFWVDSRPGDARTMVTTFVTSPPEVQTSLYAARFTAEGKPLDPGGRLVGRYRSNPTELRAAGSWGGYTLVWSEAGEIYGLYLGSSPSGPSEPIASDTVIQLSTGAGRQHSPDVGCNNSSCIVTWVDESTGNPRLIARRYSPTLEGSSDIVLPAPADVSVRLEPRVVLPMNVGATYPETPAVLLWREAAFPIGIHALQIASDNTTKNAEPMALVSTPITEGSLAVAGASAQGLCVVWETSTGNGDIHASLFDKDLKPVALDVTVAQGDIVQTAARVAVDSAGFIVAWEEPSATGNAIRTRALSAAGSLGVPLTLTEDRRATNVSLSSTVRASVSAAWVQGTVPSRNATFAQLQPGNVGLSTQPQSASMRASPDQSSPLLASNGSEYLAVWNEFLSDTDPSPKGYVARVSASGQVRGEPRQIPHAGRPIWAGTHYLLLWLETPFNSSALRYAIRAARLTPDLEVLDPAGFTVFESVNALNLLGAAFDGGRTLVIGGSKSAAFVDAQGKLETVPNFDLKKSGEPASLAHGDSGFLFVWEGQATPPSATFGYQVQGVILDASGQPAPGGWFPISDALQNTRRRPVVAHGQGQYLVAYQSDPGGLGSIRPAVTRISADGRILDSTAILIAKDATSGYINQPDVAFDGTDFVVSWSAGYRGYYQTQATHVARVSPLGVALDPSAITLGYPAQHELVLGRSSIASLGSGWTLVGYSREDVELGWTYRAKMRALFDPNANNASCFTNSDCASGHCVTGRCAANVGQAGAPSVGAAGSPLAGNSSAVAGTAGTSFASDAAGRANAGTSSVLAGRNGSAGTAGTAGRAEFGATRRPRNWDDPDSGHPRRELDGCFCNLARHRDAPWSRLAFWGVWVLGLWRRKHVRTSRRTGATC